jgi:hypothetical protein
MSQLWRSWSYSPHCPSPNQDTANVADDDDEQQTFTAIADEVEEAW